MKRNWTYTVVGYGEFPRDMLRYDEAAPATEEDAQDIEATFDLGTSPRVKAVITLHGSRPPTVARWNSFNWTVLQP